MPGSLAQRREAETDLGSAGWKACATKLVNSDQCEATFTAHHGGGFVQGG
jgi:hypothetical protein